MLQSQRSTSGNGILASLSAEDFGSLAPHLDPVAFKVRRVFFRPYEPIETVVFPESGFASVVATTESALGSIRVTAEPTVLTTQTAPSPLAMLPGSAPTGILSTTEPDSGSIW